MEERGGWFVLVIEWTSLDRVSNSSSPFLSRGATPLRGNVIAKLLPTDFVDIAGISRVCTSIPAWNEKERRERRSGEERQDRGRVLCPWTTGQDVHVETLSPAPRFQRSMLTLERLSSVTRIINYIFHFSFIPFLLYISVISANPSRKLPRIFFTWAKKIKKG